MNSPELENISLKQSSLRKSVNVHLWPHSRSTVEEKDREETALGSHYRTKTLRGSTTLSLEKAKW